MSVSGLSLLGVSSTRRDSKCCLQIYRRLINKLSISAITSRLAANFTQDNILADEMKIQIILSIFVYLRFFSWKMMWLLGVFRWIFACSSDYIHKYPITIWYSNMVVHLLTRPYLDYACVMHFNTGSPSSWSGNGNGSNFLEYLSFANYHYDAKNKL